MPRLRKSVLLFLAVCFAVLPIVFCPTSTLAETSRVIVSENFEDLNFAPGIVIYDQTQKLLYGGQSGNLAPGEFTMSIVNEGWDGGSALKIETINKGNYATGIKANFPSSIRHGKATVYGRRGNTTASGDRAYLVPIFLLGEPNPSLDPQYDYRMVQYQFYQNGISYFDTDQYMHFVVSNGSVVKYQWYKFAVEWFEDNTFDLYLNDVKVASHRQMGIYNLCTPANGINSLLITDAAVGVNDMYIDDVEVVSYDAEEITDVTPGAFWLGLKNSDDQGTRFDLKGEVYVNGNLVSEGQALCITGLTRNANKAKEASVVFGPVTSGSYFSGDTVYLKLFTRVGTTPEGEKCGGHNNAVGLRLYYDVPTRPSRIGLETAAGVFPDDLYLHSEESEFFLDAAVPTGEEQYTDSLSVNFNNGNPWVEVGIWNMPLP